MRPPGLTPFNRGDETAIELFLGGIQGWEVALRRRIDDGKACQC